MPIYYPDVLREEYEPTRFSYDTKDVVLYALGIGLGDEPLDENELPFVTDRDLKVVPTAAATLVQPYMKILDFRPFPKLPADARLSRSNALMALHGEQKIEIHRTLPTKGTFNVHHRIVDVWDKGPEKGAVIYSETVWRDDAGEKWVTGTGALYCRGDGGCGGSDKPAPEPHRPPDRAPDQTVVINTRRGLPLLFRLNGDRNPIHLYPDIAEAAGFKQPILHGLCTYGITCRAVMQTYCDYQPERILSHEVRFAAPVLAGEPIAIDMWRDGDVISFEARMQDSGLKVIKFGKTVLRG